MQLGLHALGIGAGADRAVIDAVASSADECGFATLWAGEHVVMVDRSASHYPYSDDGAISVPAQADWLDPMIALAFAALGVPFEHRAARADEYVAAMRTLWRDDVASFDGRFVGFDSIRVNPKPVRDRGIPIVMGGNSDPALRRVASLADGWYGFNLDGLTAVRERLGKLDELCAGLGRDRSELRLAVALRKPRVADFDELAALGVDELVLVEAPPERPEAAGEWVSTLADRWIAERG
ncbi:MAG: hypothetical protein QOE30_6019 [Mycobacterium sp.]|jgi:alkanesulfonate monooxygenase SsuD/methylene tetrahydromethanopterin reductase-like flavin-dependent oxidoreductase (luciferase family)|uniref:LLM class flavin-dependent oxidoreductase n=1 Tax=Mycobacterium sp. TaxID=1785 RepID=UPI0028BA7ACD|nr:LLM class flavin-dependent oxidoreductase [Mycobacterium sp.]MDT5120280.1 hypothetical protein [Mycobacterium sp.]